MVGQRGASVLYGAGEGGATSLYGAGEGRGACDLYERGGARPVYRWGAGRAWRAAGCSASLTTPREVNTTPVPVP